jgi:hypothetical protein
MGWGIPFGFRPSPSAYLYDTAREIRIRYYFILSKLVVILRLRGIDYPGGGPSLTSSGVVVGTWKTSVSRMG